MSNFIELGKINFAVACDCRKPKPGLIERACRELDIDPKRSILFGDSERDIAAAKSAGLRDGIFFTGENLFDAVKTNLEKLS